MEVCPTRWALEEALAQEIYQTVKVVVALGSSSVVQLRRSAMGWAVMSSLWLELPLAGLWEGELKLGQSMVLQSSYILLAFYPCLHH